MSEALKPSEVLAKAADLIEPEGAWTQNVLARKGAQVFATGSAPGWRGADCFCLSGALLVAAGESRSRAETKAREFLRAVIGHHFEITWNDAKERTQPEVVAALRKASELAKAEGQ